MGLSQSDRRRIAERHADIPQDPLPDMPDAPQTRTTEQPSEQPSWRRVRFSKRPPMCSECVAKAQAGSCRQVQRAVWTRAQGETSVDLCWDHAEPIRRTDDTDRLEKGRRDG